MFEMRDLKELHRLLAILQGIDVGIVVLDMNYRVQVWNSFMENHSGQTAMDALQRSFFELFPEVSEAWFRHRVETVVTLGTPSFTIWEQRPYLVRFKSYQPITGQEDFMYQNTTLSPLISPNSQIEHVCLVIYDVTSVAVNRQQLQSLNTQLEHLSRTDRLTGLYNRGHWEELLKHEVARYKRYGGMVSLLIFDIDHFKGINDTYGHQAGDKVIQNLAGLLTHCLRDTDSAGRYGGEEFVVLLPGIRRDEARLLGERLRQRAEALPVEHEGQTIRFTISMGVADMSGACHSHEQLIEHADQALYQSKRGGRNRVTVYGAL